MTRRKLARLAHMDWTEIAWRAGAHARTGIDRLQSAVRAPQWDRAALLPALAPIPELDAARAALAAGRWDEAHQLLTVHFESAPRRFLLAASDRASLARQVRDGFGGSEIDAAARANRLVEGRYDLLGYTDLRFDRAEPSAMPGAAIDWHYDPVHGSRVPRGFWASVPYLDPASGDHKVIWELNRHQHWMLLGRAFWLTGNPVYRDRVLTELAGWLADNPPLAGANWASMLELALRSLSWIWALHFFADRTQPDETPWTVDLLMGLDRQLTHVERNLSYYFSPNTHLLGEALALYVGGRSLPELAGSRRREAIGRRVLLDEIGRQITEDGGHCERSTHYHRYTLDFYVMALAIAKITGDPAAEAFERAVVRLGSAARALADDAGSVPLIGDDDGGTLWPFAGEAPSNIANSLATAAVLVNRPDLAVVPPSEETCWILSAPELAALNRPRSASPLSPAFSTALPNMGYYVSRSAAGDHLVIDGGPHGYKNAGHAHADALAVTLSVRGIPMLIDPGTGSYTVDPRLRDRMRSTALHNTVMLDGRSQSVSNGPFHWSHTADARVLAWRTDKDFDYFVGAHDGYAPAEHRRHIFMRHGDIMIVADLIEAGGAHTAAVHWHVHPRWEVESHGQRVDLACADERCQLVVASGHVERFVADEATGLGWHAPVYGRLEPATSIRVTTSGTAPFWLATAVGLDPANPICAMTFIAGEGAIALPPGAMGLRIVRERSTDEMLFVDPTGSSPARLSFRRTTPGRPAPQVLVDLCLDQPCAA